MCVWLTLIMFMDLKWLLIKTFLFLVLNGEKSLQAVAYVFIRSCAGFCVSVHSGPVI